MTDQEKNKSELARILGLGEADIDAALLASRAGEKDLAKAFSFADAQEKDNSKVFFELEVPGEPSAAKRARRRNPIGGRGAGFMFDPDESVKLTLGERFKQALPSDFVQFHGEAEVALIVYRSPPTGFPPYKLLLAELGFIRPAVAPDFDNYAKLVIDSIRKILFRDDAQIVTGLTYKMYSTRPRCVLQVNVRPQRMVK